LVYKSGTFVALDGLVLLGIETREIPCAISL